MDNRNPRPDLRGKTPNQGVGVPVKGESSETNPPVDLDATLIDLPSPAPDSDATLVDIDATMAEGIPPLPSPSPSVSFRPKANRVRVSVPLLQEGDVLGERYEILQMLGEGGMGAVYKARDRELDRFVALKLIRGELAANPAIVARFKQELLLSHQVTHKNVIRIYDMGDSDGVKFISMEFVEGRDLRALILERKKFQPEEAVEIILQVCRALEAAHSVGVIHRDLKPQNVMRDKTGRILVMDFGMARTLEGDGMTQTGALVGTMEYMSPEQALAGELDQRSDLFAVGLILYELLSGKMPYKAESALASLIKRNQERAIPVTTHDETIPGPLSNIVSKCLERDTSLRYQSAAELMADLEAWQGKRPVGASVITTATITSTNAAPVVTAPQGLRALPWKWIGAGALVVLLAVGGIFVRNRFSGAGGATAQQGPLESLAILPFRNASGDASLDWLGSSVADMLSTDVGQSAQLRTISPSSLHQIFTDLRISSATVLDPATIRRVADFSNADRVVWGQYARFGDQIRIDVTLLDIKNDRSVPLKIDVPSEKEIPGAVDKLAESIREKLALPGNVLKELRASSFQPNSS
ncbi:MAG: protein kinase, partial [Candidatus Sulfotelmatobacter sp.]